MSAPDAQMGAADQGGDIDLRSLDRSVGRSVGRPAGGDDAATLIASLVQPAAAPAPPQPTAEPSPPGPPPPPVGQTPPEPQPPAPHQPQPRPRVQDARPYPVETPRAPLTLVAIGAGLGVGLLVLAGLIAVAIRMFGAAQTTEPAGLPAVTPTAVARSAISVTASSTQESEGGITYSAENTLDGNPQTAWNSDGRKDGKGPGMSLTYRFGDPVDLYAVTVLNGYQKQITSSGKTQDLFTLNSRIQRLRVVTDTASFTWDLTDDRTPQSLTRAFGTTSSVRFEVVSVYPGQKYLDLGLSEVSFTAAN